MGISGLSVSDRGVQDDPTCDLDISKTLEWVQRCEKSHAMCNGKGPWSNLGGRVGPGPLLEVGQPGQPLIKLVQTNSPRLRYAALSYC